ncbi:GNAT family N-acetyltransferase [Pararcticibacter amylolyticus]|uniref:GNAT family N-acetyltransferase n=1 Tax=Pararcticibacter amylolyticus TaxID=2173175 RepID=A0A2U2PAU7_9SPHI|nr:GNAT family N-acetyltransferase [Pararcticibacter amylolyticus]PWG78517.1 GNAT family N-acetyltransferase [Pararcticibacter amylolyticus]
MNIRTAQRSDCRRLLELVQGLAEYEKAPHEVTISLDEFEEAGFGAQPVWKAFVAEVDGVIEAFALYYVRFSTWKGCRMYIEDVFVTEQHRRKGLGKKLFDTLFKEAREKNFSGVVWQVLDWNEPAIRFYEKFNARFDGEWINVSLDKAQIP